ncbi:MAG: aminotransferase class I/II-fold pyridoxal phosphate-dependent enzyme [Candidatus Thorarchaeota archaeon]|nr:aminotransferase class I/II-fold pyridoxal phosphate-dependent enzyme [Candidatus Thorarchaeota archaeon]
MSTRKRQPSTLCVQGEHTQTSGPAVVPIVQTSTFVFENQQQLLDSVQGKTGKDVYTRWSNPTTKNVEEKLNALEGTEDTHVLASGMAAISSAIMGLVKSGDRILSSDSIYGGTLHLFNKIISQSGVQIDYVDTAEVADRLADSGSTYKLCFFETPTNPTLKIVDIKAVADAARAKGTISMIDSTFGSPINQRPYELGIDLVMHSATKYLGGHSDIIAGTISGSKEIMADVRSAAKLLGGTMDPFASFLLDRGIKTLGVRMEKHNFNAKYLAEKLSNDSRILRVHYPGLSSHPQHDVARKQMDGFGGMMSIDLDSDLTGTSKFVDSLEIFLNAVSLGGVESLASIPALSTHYGLEESALNEMDISKSTVRLSIGIEDAVDLLNDLMTGLDVIGS